MGKSRPLFLIGIQLALANSIFLAGCPGSNMSLSETEFFQKFLIDPIPPSVTDLRLEHAGTFSDPVYVMSFKIDVNDVERIIAARRFTEQEKWTYGTDGHLRWTYEYATGDVLGETEVNEESRVVASISLGTNDTHPYKPEWLKAEKPRAVHFYCYRVNRDATNPSHITDHVLIYNENLREGYYVRSVSGGL